MPEPLVDIQNSRDERNIPIDRVGIKKVLYPITLRTRDNGPLSTVGEFTLTVDLPRHFKGTHMSRFVEVLAGHSHDLSPAEAPEILAKLRKKLDAETAHIECTFTLFLEKAAPVTKKTAMMGYKCGFRASSGPPDLMALDLIVPVTTLCPCSKEISAYGAHNQRGYVTVRVTPDLSLDTLWLEDIIDMIERVGSAPLYPLLKRPDEKFVTELAYDNPRFVEDMVRETAILFNQERRITKYRIEVENHESIHDHNAYAMIERDKNSTPTTYP